MSTLRIARVTSRASASCFRAPIQRRSYADAVSDKIKLTLALPHQVLLKLQSHWTRDNISHFIVDIQVEGRVCEVRDDDRAYG